MISVRPSLCVLLRVFINREEFIYTKKKEGEVVSCILFPDPRGGLWMRFLGPGNKATHLMVLMITRLSSQSLVQFSLSTICFPHLVPRLSWGEPGNEAKSRWCQEPWIQVGHVSLGSYKLHDVGHELSHLSLPEVVSTPSPVVVDIIDLTKVLDQTLIGCLQGLRGRGKEEREGKEEVEERKKMRRVGERR